MSLPNKNNSAPELTVAEVPSIGPRRAAALRMAGVTTVTELRAADAATLSGIKGIGLQTAARIKTWLEDHDAAPNTPERAAAVLSPPVNRSLNPDPDLAATNQEVQDEWASIEFAAARIQQAIPPRIAHKKLDKQISKLQVVLSELAEAPDTLRPKQMQRALKMLHLVASLMNKLTDLEKITSKEMNAFADELRDRRKRLEDILS